MNTSSQAAAEILGSRIRSHRESLGLSQEDVAHLAEMHVSNYGKIERGGINPRLHTIIRIASVLNTDPGEFLTGLTGEMIPASAHKLTASDLIRERSQRHM